MYAGLSITGIVGEPTACRPRQTLRRQQLTTLATYLQATSKFLFFDTNFRVPCQTVFTA